MNTQLNLNDIGYNVCDDDKTRFDAIMMAFIKYNGGQKVVRELKILRNSLFDPYQKEIIKRDIINLIVGFSGRLPNINKLHEKIDDVSYYRGF